VPNSKDSARLKPARPACLIRPALLAGLCISLLASCQSGPPPARAELSQQVGPGQSNPGQSDPGQSGPDLSGPDGLAASWLIARQALQTNDLEAAATYFSRALAVDQKNDALLRQSFLSFYQNGQIEEAALIASRIEAAGLAVALASEPAAAMAVREADWQAVTALAENLRQFDSSRPLAQLMSGWALLATGRAEAGLNELQKLTDVISRQEGADPAFMQLHMMLALEWTGQTDAARRVALELASQPGLPTRLSLQLAGALWRMGEETAADLLVDGLSASFNRARLTQLLAAGQLENSAAPQASQALAAAILDLTWFWQSRDNRQLLLLRAYLVQYMDPDNSASRFVLGQLLDSLADKSRSAEQLAGINPASGWAQPGFMLQIDQLHQAADWQRAEQMITERMRQQPENSRLAYLLGDHYRYRSEFGQAIIAYEAARALGDDSAGLWRNLGVCYEQTGADSKAEAALKKAIALNPQDAWALNYLGYWWADENRNLEAAIGLIEKAVELRPESGAFADSLGWVFYRLGDFNTAVAWLEKAHRLEPGDAVITDHLGDVYWQLGRPLEARFKWQLARDLEPEPELDELLVEKLANGLEPAK
jgi:tetratricopeptide (TPR) repeat protein